MASDTSEAIVRALADYQYWRTDFHVSAMGLLRMYCVLCEGQFIRGEPEVHEDDCLVMRARALVARQGVNAT